MVPFRLTQNVIDSFGVSGIEGVYRSCAEITLQARLGGEQGRKLCLLALLCAPPPPRQNTNNPRRSNPRKQQPT